MSAPDPAQIAEYVVTLTKIAEGNKLPCLTCDECHPWRCERHPEPVFLPVGVCVIPSCRSRGTWAAEGDGHVYRPMSASEYAKRTLRQFDGWGAGLEGSIPSRQRTRSAGASPAAPPALSDGDDHG